MGRFRYENFDQTSYEIGISGCFIEMVAAGVKDLALSTPLNSENKDILLSAVEDIAKGYNVKIYVENRLLDTNLSPEGYIDNKTILIYYKDDKILEAYLNLKDLETDAKNNNCFDQDFKNRQSVEFCKLLSYPEEIIASKYSKANLNEDVML